MQNVRTYVTNHNTQDSGQTKMVEKVVEENFREQTSTHAIENGRTGRHRHNNEHVEHRCCPPSPQCCVLIKSRHTLKVWTCVVFTVTVLTCLAVISASTWLMLDCRNKLERMRTGFENTNTKHCTNLGLQVLFACCVVLFAVFGLGCIGRQMTGYAMMIISGVAIFQSAMTIAFDECQTGVKDEILTSISSSLRACRLGTRNPPFILKNYYYANLDLDHISEKKAHYKHGGRAVSRKRKGGKNTNNDKSNDDQDDKRRQQAYYSHTSPGEFLSNGLFQNEMSSLKREDDSLVRKTIRDMVKLENFQFGGERNSERMCDAKSPYFSVLRRFVSEEEVENCVTLCHTYQDFCGDQHNEEQKKPDKRSETTTETSDTNLSVSLLEDGIGVNNTFQSMIMKMMTKTMKDNQTNHEMKREDKNGNDFDKVVQTCGTKMWNKISKFCFYDNVIFMPLSMGGPIFYFLLSLAFMYLGHCDKQIKENEDILLKEKTSNALLSSSLSESAISRRRSTIPNLNGSDIGRSNSAYTLFYESKIRGKESTVSTPGKLPSLSVHRNSNDNSHHYPHHNQSSHLLQPPSPPSPNEIPKLRVVNERTSLDSGDSRVIKYENYGINRACVNEDGDHFLTVTASDPHHSHHHRHNRHHHHHHHHQQHHHASNPQSPTTPTASTSSSTHSCLDQSFLCVPSMSVSSRMTSELYISDSD